MDRFLFFFSFTDRLLAFLMARALWFSSWHMTHIWCFLWELSFDEQRHWNSKIIERHVDGIISLFFRSRTTVSNHQIPHFEIYLVSSIKSVMIPKQASTRHIKSNMQIFNLLLCIGQPTVFLRYFVPMDFSIFFLSLLFIEWYSDCVWSRGCGWCGNEGWLALEIPIWRDVAFLWQLIFGDNFATIEMEYFFKDHRGDHTWE